MRTLEIVSRITASLLGGWLFVLGFVSLGIAALLRAGVGYADAQTLMYLLAFLVFLCAFCWSYAARSALRAWITLFGGGAAMTALAWWLAHR